MTGFKILYDEPQEAHWFKQLHPDLATATEESINSVIRTPQIQAVLAYDRPDIILLADNLSWVQFSRGASHQNYAAI